MEKDRKTLKSRWDAVCEAYMDAFCKIMEIDEDDAFWIGNEVGGLAAVGDYFVNIHDMKYVVDKDIPRQVFLRWYDYDLEVATVEMEYNASRGASKFVHISLQRYCEGAPLPYSEEELEKFRNESRG